MIRYNDSQKSQKFDTENFKKLQIYTPDGIVSFDTKGLYQVEGYGVFVKNRIEKIIGRVFNKEGILKFTDGKKIDLTMQIDTPQIIYKR